MLTVVTGAAGFVGRSVVRVMSENGYPGRVRLIDRARIRTRGSPFESVACDLSDRAALREAVSGATHVLHLAAFPGGASEADPHVSRLVNLDATLDLIDLLSRTGARLVHASSVAVLGSDFSEPVDDDTPPNPGLTYGAHKQMSEIAIADAVRRGNLNALSLRLPGVVARPRSAQGFGSAFLSDLFWAIRGGEPYTVPVSPEGTTWLLSAEQCARNLIRALSLTTGPAVATMPALHIRIGDLVEEIGRQSGREPKLSFIPQVGVQATFASYPPLKTTRADGLGLTHDGGLAQLVGNCIEQEAAA